MGAGERGGAREVAREGGAREVTRGGGAREVRPIVRWNETSRGKWKSLYTTRDPWWGSVLSSCVQNQTT